MTDQEKEIEYYRAGNTQHEHGEWRKPRWVPSRVRLPSKVYGDFPFDSVSAGLGDLDCESNKNGAVSVKSSDGTMLGLRLDEFEVLEWRENE